MSLWRLLGRAFGGILDAAGEAAGDRRQAREAQARVNEAEIAGAPASVLRLWRGLLGWVLTLLFCWEVVGRLVLLPLFFPEACKDLPPSALEQVMALLLGLLGL